MVIDPAYLAMGGDNAATCLHGPTAAAADRAVQVDRLHHPASCIMQAAHKVGSPATLDDIAWSGFAEFSAQWLLLSRRRPFDPDTGHHELWLSAGSRAGHHGLWELDVDEGTVEQPDGRRWKTSLRPVASAEAQADEQFVAASEDRRLRRRAVTFGQQRQRVWEVFGAYPDGCNATAIRDVLGINGERMARILQTLVDEGAVIKTEDQIDRRRMKVTYRRRIHPMDLSQEAAIARRTSPRDQKLYDVRSGHFVDLPKLVRPNAADLGHAPTPVAGTNPLADKPPVPPAERALPLTQKSGPDTFANGQGTQADQQQFTPTRSDPSRIPAPPPSPARTAPGAGASPLPEEAEEFLRAMNKPAWWDRRPRNPDGTVQTDAQAAAVQGPRESQVRTLSQRRGPQWTGRTSPQHSTARRGFQRPSQVQGNPHQVQGPRPCQVRTRSQMGRGPKRTGNNSPQHAAIRRGFQRPHQAQRQPHQVQGRGPCKSACTIYGMEKSKEFRPRHSEAAASGRRFLCHAWTRSLTGRVSNICLGGFEPQRYEGTKGHSER